VSTNEAIIQVQELTKRYPVKRGFLVERTVGWSSVVDKVSFDLKAGETFGLVGESGSGKTVLSRMVMGLVTPTAGDVRFKGRDVFAMKRDELFDYRRNVQLVYQNPLLSLNPRRTVGESIELPMRNFQVFGGDEAARKRKIAEILETVGLNDYHANRYPHEFSGGQIQRVGIARALASDAKVLVLDEPVSALDVSIQAQILNLLRDLKERLGLTYLFVANNLNVIEHVSDRVLVLYRGKVVELAPTSDLFNEPLHPHTKILMAAILSIDRKTAKIDLAELVRTAQAAKRGLREGPCCVYAAECAQAQEKCFCQEPPLRSVGRGHLVACHDLGSAG
jgi:oligopeptide/dipeptide ABC transporter ATP-binding protein